MNTIEAKSEAALTRYFTHHLPRHLTGDWPELFPAPGDWVGFQIQEGSRTHPWSAAIIDERIRIIPSLDAPRKLRCIFRLDLDDFLSIVGGKLRPQQAFFTRRLEIERDVLYGLRVGAILDHFFQCHPWTGHILTYDLQHRSNGECP